MRFPFFQRKATPEKQQNPGPKGGEVSLRDALYPRGTMWAPYNPDVFVMRKGGLPIYDKMRRDEQISACQGIKRLAVLCSGWDIEAASDETQDVEAADFVRENLKQLRGTLEDNIKNILTGMDYGFSITEKVWGYLEHGEFRGKVGLKALKTRKPHNFDFDTDEYGNLKPLGLWQMNGQYKYNPEKFVIYSHNKEFDNWYGTSDLQKAYRSWWSKDIIVKFWNIFLEKFGMGVPYLHPAENKAIIPEPGYTELRNAIANLQATSAIAQQTGDAIIEILESTRRGTGEFDKAIQHHDRAIGRALLMPSGVGFTDDDQKGGSYARSKTHFNVWLWIMMDLRKTVEESIMNEQIVRELVSYNYQVKKPPTFAFMPLDEPDMVELGRVWLQAIEGRAVHPDAEDEIYFRRLIKFPERDVDELQDVYDSEATKRPSGLPPGWPGMGWELQDTKIDEQGKPIKKPEPFPKQPPLQLPEKTTMQSQGYASRWHRELTVYEKRVDFGTVERSLNGIEDDARERLIGIFQKQRDKVLVSIEKAEAKINQRWVDSFSLPYGVAILGVVKDLMRTTYEAGRRDATGEISRARERRHEYVLKIPPKQVITRLEQSAFWIKNVMLDTLTKGIQALLVNMLDSGETPGETLMKIRKAYDPYVGDEQVVIDQRQIEPYRIETVIRTNTTKAYNQGRLVEFADPELDGYVRAVQLSAILDTRTTDICRSADGKILMLDDPMIKRFTPPMHHQCRSILVPITEVDGEFEPSKQEDLHGVLQKAPPDFGGNVDK